MGSPPEHRLAPPLSRPEVFHLDIYSPLPTRSSLCAPHLRLAVVVRGRGRRKDPLDEHELADRLRMACGVANAEISAERVSDPALSGIEGRECNATLHSRSGL